MFVRLRVIRLKWRGSNLFNPDYCINGVQYMRQYVNISSMLVLLHLYDHSLHRLRVSGLSFCQVAKFSNNWLTSCKSAELASR